MSNNSQTYLLPYELRNQLIQKFGALQREKILLEQSARDQQAQVAATTETLFLELLEVGDALETLLEYLVEHPQPSPEFFQRLPKSLGAVHRKFLNVLKKRQVSPIELEGEQPDFNLCQVIEREVRPDLADQTITKTLRQGYRLGDKVLRPVEVITSKTE